MTVSFALWLLLVSILLPVTLAIVPGSDNWAQQGFYFDWNNATSPLPTSITGQCDNINVKWYRGTGVGPDPVSPYVFKVYSSMYINPFVINAGNQLQASLPIPFDPQSRYLVCMTDSTGISGGCQDLYTVYPTGNTTCANVTMPAEILGVKMTSLDTGGSLSRFGWPAKCSDLQFDLETGIEGGIVGTPPYTLTIAPALRTPVNITFEKSARWTIMLDHGHPFFVSIVDSKGVTWSNGPLHAGAGTLSCFAPARPYPWLTLAASLGMSFSFLVIGAILASLVFLWYLRRPQFDVGPAAAGRIGEAPENSRRSSSHHQRHLSSTFSRESKSRMSTNTTSRQQQQQEESHLSSRSQHGSTSPTAVGAVLTSLHRRRPSNTRAASSSEMGLMMRHRPSLRREETSGTIDLAASPIDGEGQHTFPPPPQPNYNNNNSTVPRRENDPNYIIPWSQLAHENRGQEPFVLHEEGRGSMPNTPGISTLKHRDASTSNSSGVPSPTAGGGAGVTVTPGQEMPSNLPSGNSRPNVVSLPSLPRTGDFTVSNTTQASVPLISLPQPQHYPHQAAFSSVSSSSMPPHHHPQQMMGTPSQQQQQQQQHTHTHEVYVVHHDAGLPPPVTVFTRPGTLVTELPPGYDHIISTSQQPDHPVHFDESQIYDGHGASTPMRPLKGRPSTSNTDSQQQQPQQPYMQQGANRPDGGTGLTLVHPEDVPLSAISPTSPSNFPQPSSQQSTDEHFHQS